MDSKRITFDIEGKKITCFFAGNHFHGFLLERLDTATLLKAFKGESSPTDLMDMMPAIFYAGYKAQSKIESKAPEINYDSFESFFMGSTIESRQKLLGQFVSLFNS